MKPQFRLSLIALMSALACAPIGSRQMLPTPTLWVPPAVPMSTPEAEQTKASASMPEVISSSTPTIAMLPTLPPTEIPLLSAVVLSPIETMQTDAQWVLSLAWAPDNSKFLVGTGGGRAKVMVGDPMTGEWILQIPARVENVRQVTWSPNGASLAIAEGEGGQMFGLLDAVTGTPQTAFGESAAVCLAWSPDGEILAVGTDYGDLALWKPGIDEIVATLDGGNNDIDGAAWSLDGTKIATAVAGDVIVWSWDGKETKRLLTIQDAGEKVSWSPDGSMLATEGQHGGIWNAETGERLVDLGDSILPSWSPDSAIIVTATHQDVVVLDATTGAHLFTAQGHTRSVKAIAWSPDGTLIASGDQDGVVMVWGVRR